MSLGLWEFFWDQGAWSGVAIPTIAQPLSTQDLRSGIFDEGYFDPALPLQDDNPEVVAIGFDAVDEDEPEIGLDFSDPGAVDPVFADQAEIVGLAAEDDFEPEAGLDLVQDGTPDAVYADIAEIVALSAEELEPDEAGLDFTDALPDLSLPPAAAFLAAQVLSVFDLSAPSFDAGYFDAIADFGGSAFDENGFAAIGILAAEEIDLLVEDDPGYLEPRPLVEESQGGVCAISSVFLAPDDEVEGFVDSNAVLDPAAVQPALIDTLAAEDTSEEFAFEGLAEPNLQEDALGPQPAIIESLAATEDDFEPESGLDLVADEAIQPVFADTVEIVVLQADDGTEIEGEEELDRYRLFQALVIDSPEPILVGQALDDPADEDEIVDFGAFDTVALDGGIPTLFANPEYVVGYAAVPKRRLGYPALPVRVVPTRLS
jgi:hypothetical protein